MKFAIFEKYICRNVPNGEESRVGTRNSRKIGVIMNKNKCTKKNECITKNSEMQLLIGQEEQLTHEQVVAYLERIQLENLALQFENSLVKPTLQLLDTIIYAHQTNIAFSTVDIVSLGCAPLLELDALVQKIIVDKHGGYCFELNMLFEKLLKALNFDVRACFCKSVRGRSVAAGINHRAEIVRINGNDYFADVGFGGPVSSCALLVSENSSDNATLANRTISLDSKNSNEVTHSHANYAPAQIKDAEAFYCEKINSTWWSIQRKTATAQSSSNKCSEASKRGANSKEIYQTELLFCTSFACDADFHLLSSALSQPGSLFRDHAIVNLRTPNGYIAFNDMELKVRDMQSSSAQKCKAQEHKTTVRTETFSSKKERNEALKKFVGFEPYYS